MYIYDEEIIIDCVGPSTARADTINDKCFIVL